MSHNSHQERYITKLLIGFALLIGFVGLVFYAIFEGAKKGDWYYWAIVAATMLCLGVYFTLSAIVHKIKHDFSRRQKAREQHKATIE